MIKRLSCSVAIAALVIVQSGAAFAHVSVNPSEAAQGDFTELSFRVPNERGDASTVKLEVAFPSESPIPFVSVRPVPGWDYKVETTKLATPIDAEGEQITEAVSKITWSGGSIKRGEYQAFPVSVGPLPEVDSITFNATQTYSNGERVEWVEQTPAGGDEPEHPAPVLTLTQAEPDAQTDGGSEVAASSTDNSDSNDDSNVLAIIALIVGALGLVVGGVALARSRTATT